MFRLWRAVSWVFRSRWRLVGFGWLVGFFVIGQAGMARADDGLITGPNLGTSGGQTVFEQFGPERFALYLQLSDSNHGAPYVKEAMWNILRAIESALMYLVGALARGAITSMEWMLNLNLYTDNATQIDTAVRSVAAQVFWPLFAATMAVGAFSAYTRMRREGGGSLFNDAAWLVAASVFAGAFATAPSTIMADLDQARTAISTAAMKGYAGYGPAGTSAAGFPHVSTPTDQSGATRKLADALWNVYVVTPWCYVNFNSLTTCADLGDDYITGSPRWNNLTEWMAGNNGGNSDDGNGSPYCPPKLNQSCDWIRGQSFGRLGATIFVVSVTVPLVGMLLVFVLYGVMALVGFLLLILIGLFFVLGWMIPGRPRQMGVRWVEEVFGSLIHLIIITAILGSVMVLGAILNAGIPTYGFFMVGLLDLATFIVGFRMRGRLESIAGLGAGGTASPFSGYMAMRAIGALGRSTQRLTRGAIGGAVSAAPIAAGAALGAARLGGLGIGAAGRHTADGARLLRTLPNNLLTARPSGTATPYRPGSTGQKPDARRVISPTPRAAGAASGTATLPAGATARRGRARALESPGMTIRTAGGRRVYVSATIPTPRRTFSPSTQGTRSRARGKLDETPGISGSGPHRPTVNLTKPLPNARRYQPSPRSQVPPRTELAAPPTRRAVTSPRSTPPPPT